MEDAPNLQTTQVPLVRTYTETPEDRQLRREGWRKEGGRFYRLKEVRDPKTGVPKFEQESRESVPEAKAEQQKASAQEKQ